MQQILRILLTVVWTCQAVDPGPLAKWSRTFDLQEYQLSAENKQQITDLLYRHFSPGIVVVVEGTACISGGKDAAMHYATARKGEVEEFLLESGVSRNAILSASEKIITGPAEKSFRTASIELYVNMTAARQAVDQKESQNRATIAWILSGAIVLLIAFWLLRSRKEKQQKEKLQLHTLSHEEADAIQVLTGGAVVPLKKATEQKTRKPNFIKKAGKNMAKKKEAKVTPISIRGAVAKGFENKSLSELARSPVSALEGLEGRHALLLEEAFGVKTVEDLAALRYVEIARAIAILARYES